MILMQKSRQADYRAAFSREIWCRLLYLLLWLFSKEMLAKYIIFTVLKDTIQHCILFPNTPRSTLFCVLPGLSWDTRKLGSVTLGIHHQGPQWGCSEAATPLLHHYSKGIDCDFTIYFNVIHPFNISIPIGIPFPALYQKFVHYGKL